MKTVTGNTFPVKEQLKALGGRWDPATKGWRVPDENFDSAMALVASAPKGYVAGVVGPNYSAPRARRAWRPCGYPGCNRSHCDECEGQGFYL